MVVDAIADARRRSLHSMAGMVGVSGDRLHLSDKNVEARRQINVSIAPVPGCRAVSEARPDAKTMAATEMVKDPTPGSALK